MIVEEFDNGYICIHRYEDNTVFMSVNNDFQEIPEWNRSIQVLRKEFASIENAKKYFFELKRLVEFKEEETKKIPEGYIKVSVSSYNKGGEGDTLIEEDYYCRPEDAEALKAFRLKHHEKECFCDIDEAKRFYQFCLKNDVLDEEFNHASDTSNFCVVGIGTIREYL